MDYAVIDYFKIQAKDFSNEWFVELELNNGLFLCYTANDGDVEFLSASDDEVYQLADSATKQTLTNFVWDLVNV